ncbi:hypothetical protein CLU79DRAFT_766260 [Phycomyces nitens]|nr:hypothetical protein CLU79DRAFT_766260 [Phycomyces nitens]
METQTEATHIETRTQPHLYHQFTENSHQFNLALTTNKSADYDLRHGTDTKKINKMCNAKQRYFGQSRKTYICHTCKRSLCSAYSLNRHQATHYLTTQRNDMCNLCSKTFSNKANLRRHIRLCHTKTPNT